MDPRTQVAQGVAGTGSAYILEDRYDPADMVLRMGTVLAQQKVAKQQKALKNIEAFKTTLEKLEIDPKWSQGVAEMESFRDTAMDQLKALSIQYGPETIDDPTSPTGKYFGGVKARLQEMSLMQEEGKKMYESQLNAFADKPADYDADAFNARMEEYSKLETVKEKFDFLSGKNNTLKPSEGYGSGLLVQSLDWTDPVEGITAAIYKSDIENGDVTIVSSEPDKKKIKAAVLAQLTSGQYDAYISKHSPLNSKGVPDVDAYADKLTDYIYNQEEVSFKKSIDEEKISSPFSFSNGSGYQDLKGITMVYGVEEGRLEGTQSFVPMDFGSVAISTKKGGMPSVFNYDFVNETTGKTETVKINPTKIVERNGRMYLQGAVAADVELATLNGSDLNFFEEDGTGKDKKNKLTEISLDDEKGNDVKFEAQFGISVPQVRSNIEQVKRSKQAVRDAQISKEVDMGIEDAKKNLTKDGSITPLMTETLANATKGVKKGEYKIEVEGREYDLSTETGRILFNAKYGSKLK
jgi:hypothetical protein